MSCGGFSDNMVQITTKARRFYGFLKPLESFYLRGTVTAAHFESYSVWGSAKAVAHASSMTCLPIISMRRDMDLISALCPDLIE
jgi:hypothetical protein